MGSDLPEWFNDKIEQWLFEEGISENSWTFDMLKDGSEWAFRELSKPENAAKIPVVKPLIERLKREIRNGMNHFDDCAVFFESCESYDIDDNEEEICNCGAAWEYEQSLLALEPFKKEGSDEI